MHNQKNENKDPVTNTGHATGMKGSAENYSENVVLNAARGHGFAAEKANHLIDKFSGEDAQLIGNNNAKDGADRIVNGQQIQTKYCSSGSKCIAETFRDGKFRYIDSNGNPMKIEVPSDMYEDAVKAMEERIKKGEIPSIKDPAAARELVRKGYITYEQARNIAKAGTVESLTYDAANGIKLAGTAMGLTALLTYAMNIWQGKSKIDALDAACFNGICVGGVAWVTSIMTSQIGRTGIENTFRTGSDWAVKQMNTKVINALANAFRDGSKISGAAAANHVSKILRGQATAAIIVTTVLSIDDFIYLFSKEISGTQAFKNICKTAAGVAGGAAGLWAGAAIGSAVGPAGTVAGGAAGAIGALVGSWGSSKLAKLGLDAVIDDDSLYIGALMEQTFGKLADDYLLSEREAKSAIAAFRQLDMKKTIQSIHASNNHFEFTANLIHPFIENEAMNRPPIFLPSKKKLATATENFISKLEQTEIIN